jgi:hypothetical protein
MTYPLLPQRLSQFFHAPYHLKEAISWFEAREFQRGAANFPIREICPPCIHLWRLSDRRVAIGLASRARYTLDPYQLRGYLAA